MVLQKVVEVRVAVIDWNEMITVVSSKTVRQFNEWEVFKVQYLVIVMTPDRPGYHSSQRSLKGNC